MADTEIERRIFTCGDQGEVTATRVRITPPEGFQGFPTDVIPKDPVQAIHLRAPWGQRIITTADSPLLADMTEAELSALCRKAFFGAVEALSE